LTVARRQERVDLLGARLRATLVMRFRTPGSKEKAYSPRRPRDADKVRTTDLRTSGFAAAVRLAWVVGVSPHHGTLSRRSANAAAPSDSPSDIVMASDRVPV
jgi:hypothetical protein